MSRRLASRLAALEAVTHGANGCPHRVYAWCVEHGMAAPEPADGERLPDWLERVPTITLEALLNANG